MKKFMVWYCKKMIALCDLALQYDDGADGIHEVNEIVEVKNYFMRQQMFYEQSI